MSSPTSDAEDVLLKCFSCGDEHPQDELSPVAGAGKRSPRHFCDDCVEAAKKGWGGW